jgi:DNA repair exonuclease SbcCD ATPase subunit
MDAPLQIVELRAENVKRLRAVTIRPDEHGNLVVLSGANGAGKSSVLDAIAMALGGADQIPSEPIRRGADRAEVVVDLGEMIVRRTFTASNGGALTVTTRDGARFGSPQTLLDKLVGRLSFDPLAFSREPAKRQAEILRELLGLDFGQIDAQREALYSERAAVNKQVVQAKARLEAMPQHPDAPTEPIDVGVVASELQAAQQANQESANNLRAFERARDDVEARRSRVESLRAQLAQAEDALRSSQEAVANLECRVAQTPPVDTAPLLARIRDAETTNRKVRENQQRQAIASELAKHQDASAAFTESIDQVDAKKAAAIAGAAMPVPGLGFDAAGIVTLNGLPLEQASAAEKLRVSVAIGLAMNPRLRVLLIRDASLLDAASMRLVAEMAQAAQAQVWVEVVAEPGEGVGIVIEDGQVRGAEVAEAF